MSSALEGWSPTRLRSRCNDQAGVKSASGRSRTRLSPASGRPSPCRRCFGCAPTRHSCIASAPGEQSYIPAVVSHCHSDHQHQERGNCREFAYERVTALNAKGVSTVPLQHPTAGASGAKRGIIYYFRRARVAKLADARDLKSSTRDPVPPIYLLISAIYIQTIGRVRLTQGFHSFAALAACFHAGETHDPRRQGSRLQA